MKKELLGTFTYAEFAAHISVFLPIMAASAVLHREDPTKRLQGRWMRRFGRSAARATPLWKFDVVGEPPADIGTKGYVVVANHESNIDPFLLSFLPWDMRWIAKESLFKVPVIAGSCTSVVTFLSGGAIAAARWRCSAKRRRPSSTACRS